MHGNFVFVIDMVRLKSIIGNGISGKDILGDVFTVALVL